MKPDEVASAFVELPGGELVDDHRRPVKRVISTKPVSIQPYVLVQASRVMTRKVAWAWRGRIAYGKLNMVEGDPGQLKSSLLLDLAARLTSGIPMPFDAQERQPGDVIILSAEDDPEDTLVPRLTVAGADLDRVHFLTAVRDDKGKLAPFVLNRDVPRLTEAIKNTKAKFLIIDPPAAYLGKVDTWKDADVRTAIAPLQEMARDHGVAVVFNRHFNKGSGKALYKGGGSIAFTAAARVVLQVHPDPIEEGVKVVVVAKCNLAKPADALRFRAVLSDPSDEESPLKIEWVGTSDHSADDLLEAERDGGSAKVRAAEVFLREVLADGPMDNEEVKAKAKAAGITRDPLWKAKNCLKVKATKKGMTGGWTWGLP